MSLVTSVKATIHLTECNCLVDWADTSNMSQEPSPLENLHPSSFDSLTHLSFTIMLFLEMDDDWENPIPDDNVFLDSPYMGLCNSPLASLHALRYLHINLVIQGHLGLVSQRSFGPQWGQLPDTLSTPCAFPRLSEVTLAIEIRAPDNIKGFSAEDSLARAEAVRQSILSYVYPAQFKSLMALNQEGTLRFGFEVNATVGPPLGMYSRRWGGRT